jgi:ketosteroid isomerase-like protein
MAAADRKPLEIVREMLAAFARGDYEAALAAFDPELRGDFGHMPDGRITHGRDAMRSEVARWQGAWTGLTTEYEGIGAAGDRVAVLVHQCGTGKGSGAPMEMRYGQVFTVKAGAITEMKTYLDPDEALRDAGVKRSDLVT